MMGIFIPKRKVIILTRGFPLIVGKSGISHKKIGKYRILCKTIGKLSSLTSPSCNNIWIIELKRHYFLLSSNFKMEIGLDELYYSPTKVYYFFGR